VKFECAAPGLYGAPPENIGSMTWIRATVVDLLDLSTVAFDGSEGPPSDTDIALVTLLYRGLAELGEGANVVRGGTTTALRKERNAIAQVRRRRSPMTVLARAGVPEGRKLRHALEGAREAPSTTSALKQLEEVLSAPAIARWVRPLEQEGVGAPGAAPAQRKRRRRAKST
jgi:hypothetical protein